MEVRIRRALSDDGTPFGFFAEQGHYGQRGSHQFPAQFSLERAKQDALNGYGVTEDEWIEPADTTYIVLVARHGQ